MRQLAAAADKVGGGARAIEDEALLDEVTALVERPNVLVCSFEREFLDVPQECLILTMKANQKYFPLLDATGKLTHQFLVVSNISPDDASAVVQRAVAYVHQLGQDLGGVIADEAYTQELVGAVDESLQPTPPPITTAAMESSV